MCYNIFSKFNKQTNLGGFYYWDLVNEIVMDIEEIPADPVTYEVWAIGHDEEDRVPMLRCFLVFLKILIGQYFAKETSLAELLIARDDWDSPITLFLLKVETVVPDDERQYEHRYLSKTIELFFEELPEYITVQDRVLKKEHSVPMNIRRRLTKNLGRLPLIISTTGYLNLKFNLCYNVAIPKLYSVSNIIKRLFLKLQ